MRICILLCCCFVLFVSMVWCLFSFFLSLFLFLFFIFYFCVRMALRSFHFDDDSDLDLDLARFLQAKSNILCHMLIFVINNRKICVYIEQSVFSYQILRLAMALSIFGGLFGATASQTTLSKLLLRTFAINYTIAILGLRVFPFIFFLLLFKRFFGYKIKCDYYANLSIYRSDTVDISFKARNVVGVDRQRFCKVSKISY